jgi:hypothetical protein
VGHGQQTHHSGAVNELEDLRLVHRSRGRGQLIQLGDQMSQQSVARGRQAVRRVGGEAHLVMVLRGSSAFTAWSQACHRE